MVGRKMVGAWMVWALCAGSALAQSIGERPAQSAARLSAQVLDAAAGAAAAGVQLDTSKLIRMGGLPPQLVKWGQISSPWKAGQFMDVEQGADGAVRVSIPSIPRAMCQSALEELSQQPSMDAYEAGGLVLRVGQPWKVADLESLCAAMEKGPTKMRAGSSMRDIVAPER